MMRLPSLGPIPGATTGVCDSNDENAGGICLLKDEPISKPANPHPAKMFAFARVSLRIEQNSFDGGFNRSDKSARNRNAAFGVPMTSHSKFLGCESMEIDDHGVFRNSSRN